MSTESSLSRCLQMFPMLQSQLDDITSKLSDGDHRPETETQKPQMKEIRAFVPEWRQRTATAVLEWKPEREMLTAFEADDKGFYKSEGSIEMRIDRFSEFVRDSSPIKSRFSVPVFIRGLPWKIRVDSKVNSTGQSNNPNGKSPSKNLAVYLYCSNNSANEKWECQAIYALSVKAQKEDVENIIRKDLNNIFNVKHNTWGFANLVTCDELLDPGKGFVKDDVVILQAHVRVKAVSGVHAIDNGRIFSPLTEYRWDFTLTIQNKQVCVKKSYLAMHSNYFEEQFRKHELASRAILQGIDYDEFIELLSVIYPTCCPITVANVETISKLAFHFEMAALLKQCETFLMEHSKEFGRPKALLMAEWERSSMKIKPDYNALSHRTKRMLFDKICSPVSVPNPVSVPEELAISISRAPEILQELLSSACCPSDGVLVVENKRILIHKTYLAVYSEYFKAMFQGEFEEGNKDEIVLEEVSYSEILELLAVIYPTLSPITDTNVGTILKMADRFMMPSISARCKKILHNSTQIRAARKLWLAQSYNLPDLQQEYALKYKTMTDVTKLKAEPEFGMLDDETRAMILDSITSS